MAYTKTLWQPRVAVGRNRFLKSQETPTEVYLDNEPVSITEPGTPFSAENMNNIEDGIEAAHNLIEEEVQSREHGDEALGQAIEEALQEAKNYTNEAQLATQTWLRAVNTKAELPASGLNNNINYLCRVIADPDQANNGVYQAIAGWTSEPQWTFFSDNADWIDEIELDDAITEHNESGEAHEDIRDALSIEEQARKDADDSLLERLEALAPEGLDNLPQLFAQEAQARQQGDEAIIDQLALKANLASPALTGTPTAPTAANGNNSDQIATTKYVIKTAHPVGSIYMSVDSTNPATLFGGTWTLWGRGEVPVGVKTDDSDFNTVEKPGGAKTHQLTPAQMPAHAHGIRVEWGDGTGNINAIGEMLLKDGATLVTLWQTFKVDQGSATSYAGNNVAHNNLQPYRTCYMWKRMV